AILRAITGGPQWPRHALHFTQIAHSPIKGQHPLGRAGVGCKEGAKSHAAQSTCHLRHLLRRTTPHHYYKPNRKSPKTTPEAWFLGIFSYNSPFPEGRGQGGWAFTLPRTPG